MNVRCDSCHRDWTVANLLKASDVPCPGCGAHARLISSSGNSVLVLPGPQGEARELVLEGPATIGSADSNSFVLKHPTVAGFHARVVPIDGPAGVRWRLESVQSNAPTRVNSIPVSRQPLENGDWIEIGSVGLRYVAGKPPAVSLSILEGFASQTEQVSPGDAKPDAAQLIQRLTAVQAVAAELAGLAGEHALADRLCAAVRDLFAPSRCAVLRLYGPLAAAGPLPLRAQASFSEDSDPSEEPPIRVSSTLIRRVLELRAPIAIRDTEQDDDVPSTASLVDSMARSILAAPLVCQGDVWGVLYADRTERRPAFDAADKPLFGTLAVLSGAALAADRESRRREQLSLERVELARHLPPALLDEVASGRLAWEAGGVEREVTMLVIDVRGLWGGSEIPSVLAAGLLNDFYSRIVPEIWRQEGTLDRFLVSGVLAVWGSPLARHTDALAAVRAALAIRRAVRQLVPEAPGAGHAPLAAGMLIESVPVVAGSVGVPHRMERTVIGPGVDLAARLVLKAADGQILLGPNAYAHVSGQVPVRPVGKMWRRDRTDSATLYEVLDEPGVAPNPSRLLPRKVLLQRPGRPEPLLAILTVLEGERLRLVMRPEDALESTFDLFLRAGKPAVRCEVQEAASGTDARGRPARVVTARLEQSEVARLIELLERAE